MPGSSSPPRRGLLFRDPRRGAAGFTLLLGLLLIGLPAAVIAAPAERPACTASGPSLLEPTGYGAYVDPTGTCLDYPALARWIDMKVLPLPTGPQMPLSYYRAQGQEGWRAFRAPFPPVPVWNPPGTKRVGLQVGHWQYADAPDELADLRTNPGAHGGGYAEWEAMLEITERAAVYLREAGVEVDVLPVTVPVRYRAHAFVTIHADGDGSGTLRGFKIARPGFSAIPAVDDELVAALNVEYADATGFAQVDHQITGRMRAYYAFNARRYQHAVAPGVPQAIVETGFMTSAADRELLIGDPDRAARGIARGILRFLEAEYR